MASLFARLQPHLAQLAVLWIVLAIVELALGAAIENSMLHNADLPLGAKVALVAHGLAALLAGIAVVAIPIAALGRLSRIESPRIGRLAAAVVRGFVVWLVVFLYVTSWAAFWSAGVFLDREAFLFWTPHPIQVFHWVYPPLAIGVIVITGAAAVVLGRVLPRWVAAWPVAAKRRVVLASAVMAVVCGIAAAGGGPAYDQAVALSAGIGLSKSGYVVARDQHLSPMLHTIADLRGQLHAAAPAQAAAATTSTVVRRPLVSMNEYLAGADLARMKRLNVVMLQIESLRSDQLRVYGGVRDVMPTVDALARESRVFTNAYVQASHSNYTDVVPLSSHYPLRSAAAYAFPRNPTYPRVLIYDILKAVGFKTAVISSQNENWSGMINYHRPENLDRFFHAETFTGPTYTPWQDLGFAGWAKATSSAGSVDDRYTVDEAIKWIDEVAGQPFFLHMNLQSSHVPYVVPEGFKRPFGPDRIDFAIMWGSFPTDKVDVVKARYADSLYYEDLQIRRLFDHLRQRGVWENTIVVIGGDNGEAFYEHGFTAHAGPVVNEVMKVPMIIRVPGVAPGLDDRPAMFLDVPPSLLQVLGLPAHPGYQGISLFEDQPNPNRSLYMIVQTPLAYQSAIVRGDFKLIFSEREGKYLLFNLRNDPGEFRDLADSRPDVRDGLAARLHQWRREQLAYYADIPRQTKEYPPVIAD